MELLCALIQDTSCVSPEQRFFRSLLVAIARTNPLREGNAKLLGSLAQIHSAKQNATTYQFVNLSLPPRSRLNPSKKSLSTRDPPPSTPGHNPAISRAGGSAKSPSRDPFPPPDISNTRNYAIYQVCFRHSNQQRHTPNAQGNTFKTPLLY